jgi:hypothetical protein
VTCWVHLSQVPEEIRDALAQVEAPHREEDTRLEQALLRAARSERLRSRVPALVRAALSSHCSTRQAIQAVALHAGLSESYIRALYYGPRRPK